LFGKRGFNKEVNREPRNFFLGLSAGVVFRYKDPRDPLLPEL
jgi:hypothetical protein